MITPRYILTLLFTLLLALPATAEPRPIDETTDDLRQVVADLDERRAAHYADDEGEPHRRALSAFRALELARGLLADYEASLDTSPPAEPEPIDDTPATPDEAHVPDAGDTLADALRDLADNGKRLILLPAGRWELGADDGLKHGGPGEGEKVTIKAMPGVAREDVVLYNTEWRTWRPHCSITYEGVSIDWANVNRFYYGVEGFRNCVWFDSRPYDEPAPEHRKTPVRGGYWFEDGLARDMLYGAVGADRVERSRFENIYGDVFQGSLIVRDCVVDGVDGSLLQHHSDTFQMYEPADHILWENITIRNIDAAVFMIQTFALPYPEDAEPFDERVTISNMTIRNVRVEGGGSSNSQIHAGWLDNVVIDGLHMPDQVLRLRTGHHGKPSGFRNVVIKNSTLHPDSQLDVEGVEVIE